MCKHDGAVLLLQGAYIALLSKQYPDIEAERDWQPSLLQVLGTVLKEGVV